MYQSEEPLGEFFKELLYSAKESGYKIVVTLLAREADSEKMYSDIMKYWTSLHDVTGENILFVLNGYVRKPKFSEKNRLLYGKGGIVYKNKNIVFASDKYLKSSFRESELREGHIEPKNNLKKSHSMEISSLKDTFHLREKDIPSLLIFLLDSDTLLNPAQIVPLSEISNIYKYLKNMNENLEDLFYKLRYTDIKLEELIQYLEDIKSSKATELLTVLDKYSLKVQIMINKIYTIRSSSYYDEEKKQEGYKILNLIRKEFRNENKKDFYFLENSLQSILTKPTFYVIPNLDFKIKQLNKEINVIMYEQTILWGSISKRIQDTSKYTNKNCIRNQNINNLRDIFISHSSAEKELLALPLYNYLEKLNLKPWIDKKNIQGSDSLFLKINEGLREAENYVVIISPSFIKSSWTKKELTAIFIQHIENKKKVFIILHNLSINDFKDEYPLFSDLIIYESNKENIRNISNKINVVINDKKS